MRRCDRSGVTVLAAWVDESRSATAKRKAVAAARQFDSIVAYYAFNESCLEALAEAIGGAE